MSILLRCSDVVIQCENCAASFCGNFNTTVIDFWFFHSCHMQYVLDRSLVRDTANRYHKMVLMTGYVVSQEDCNRTQDCSQTDTRFLPMQSLQNVRWVHIFPAKDGSNLGR